jgi:hypothetical protein
VPPFAAASYPVDTKYTFSNTNCHLSKPTTDVFDILMVTYGNGELCSKLLYNAMNRAYLQRVEAYYSLIQEEKKATSTPPSSYVPKDGVYIKQY